MKRKVSITIEVDKLFDENGIHRCKVDETYCKFYVMGTFGEWYCVMSGDGIDDHIPINDCPIKFV